MILLDGKPCLLMSSGAVRGGARGGMSRVGSAVAASMKPPPAWPAFTLPVCPLHDVDVPLAHVPDHAWRGLSDEGWAANLALYEDHPEWFLAQQCEGECWCRMPDQRAHSWAGHGRGPKPCRFENRPFRVDLIRAFVAFRQAKAAGWPLPSADPVTLIETVDALAHPTDWCSCLPALIGRLDELPDLLSRGWSFETFPTADPAVSVMKRWIDNLQSPARPWMFISGDVGRGKTGLSAAIARDVVGGTGRTALLSRGGPLLEELRGETGRFLVRWLEAVDLLVLDDLDFGWAVFEPGASESMQLASALNERLNAGIPVVLTAHGPLWSILQRMDPALQDLIETAAPVQVSLTGGPSLRTGRTW